MGDDGAGAEAIRLLKHRLRGRNDVVLKEMNSMELPLAEAMMGYSKVILIDAIVTPREQSGKVHHLTMQDLREQDYLSTSHSMSFPAAFDFICKLDPAPAPQEVEIYAVEIPDVREFSTEISPKVREGVKEAVQEVLNEVSSTNHIAG